VVLALPTSNYGRPRTLRTERGHNHEEHDRDPRNACHSRRSRPRTCSGLGHGLDLTRLLGRNSHRALLGGLDDQRHEFGLDVPRVVGGFGLPPNFSAPAYTFGFTSGGHLYGGPVSEQPNFQSPSWSAPVPCAGIYTASCAISGNAFGSFAFTDPNHFTLDVFVGTGHEHTELVGVGHRVGVTTSTPEPASIGLGAIGLLGAALLRRRRTASSPLPHDA
jgi:MYXO-CTERM domain-containing protein